MTHTEAQLRAAELRQQLNEHNHRYYVLAQPTISDREFDLLMDELQKIEDSYPELRTADSPTQRVGGTVTKEFATVKHRHPMLSLANSYSKEEVDDFAQRIYKTLGREVEYVCELKFDGVAIGLRYENGVLVQGVTRGDGTQGDDVTANVRTVRHLPLKLQGDFPTNVEFRGEVYLPRPEFDRINREREEIGEPTYANPRNTAAGTLKLQDSAQVADRKLACFVYAVILDEGGTGTHMGDLNLARAWGLPISNHARVCQNVNEVMDYLNHWDVARHQLPFDTDGVVIKVNNLTDQTALGFTAKSPRWAVAYKFASEQAATVLETVTYQVGRTGAITPVANLRPVLLAGTTVKRASLHNADQIAKLDLHLGDTVLVEKGGEIIPKIVGVDVAQRLMAAVPVGFIENCPECGSQLVRADGEAQHYCPNALGCAPQIKGRIEHFIGRKAMDIDGLGEETVTQLYEAQLINNVADLYELNYDQLIALDRMADKSARNLLDGIAQSRNVPFARVLFALGIRHVGETMAKKLAKQFRTIDALMAANIDELTSTDEVGEVVAQSIINFFADPRNCQTVDRLKSYGLQMSLGDDHAPVSNALNGAAFVVSGVFSKFSRDGIKDAIEAHGGKNVGSISAKTDYVLAGENMGPAKLEKARKLGIQIISEDEFLLMIGGNTPTPSIENKSEGQLGLF